MTVRVVYHNYGDDSGVRVVYHNYGDGSEVRVVYHNYGAAVGLIYFITIMVTFT